MEQNPTAPVKVFICYAREDWEMASQLYDDLRRAGVDPWMDRKNLRPGQKWRALINQAIRQSAYVIALLSSHSVSKRGFVQKELKEALDVVDELPPTDIFVIPVRLDNCDPLDERLQELQWVDLFDSYDKGLAQILQVLCPSTPEQVEPPTPVSSRRSDREAEYDLLSEKLSRLRQARILETDAATLFKLDKQIETAERQQAQLEQELAGRMAREEPERPVQKQPVKKQPAQQPPKQATPKPNVIRLRSEPLRVSTEKFINVFKLDEKRRPLEYIQNDYEDLGNVVVDHATGLMW